MLEVTASCGQGGSLITGSSREQLYRCHRMQYKEKRNAVPRSMGYEYIMYRLIPVPLRDRLLSKQVRYQVCSSALLS